MTGKLTMFVHAFERDANGNPGRSQVFGPTDVVPEWALAAITNPKVWNGEPPKPKPEKAVAPTPTPEPPRHGAGSSREAWVAHAVSLGFEVTDDAKREDVIAAVDAKKE